MPYLNKIGFHTGPGGNPTGIGTYLQTLDSKGIPATVKAVDSMTGIFEGQELAKKSGVPHTLVYRRSLPFDDGMNAEVPDYSLSPGAAAGKLWTAHRRAFPPELDPTLTWVEVTNEPRQTLEWASWLGNFASEVAVRALADDFKFSAFGFAPGNPDDGAWETPGMIRFLKLCEQFPDRLSIALHEYSLTTSEILSPGLVGRFQDLFSSCDKLGIRRPTVIITEWGWTYNDVPDLPIALEHIRQGAELYAQFPEVLGAALWYLGPGFGGIANNAQPLIAPVTELAQEILEIPENPDPEPPSPKYRVVVNLLPQDASLDEKILVVRRTHDGKETILQSADDAVTLVRSGSPESLVKLWWPDRWAGDIEQWLRDRSVRNIGIFPILQPIDITDSLPKHPTRRYQTRSLDQIKTLTIHHTVSPPDRSIESIALYHVNSRGWPGIGYHFVILGDGKIYQTNHLTTKSYHAGSSLAPGDENLTSVGIALQGNFTSEPPTPSQIRACQQLIRWLKERLPQPLEIKGHREMPGAQTQCPGNTWDQWKQGLLETISEGTQTSPQPPTGDVSLPLIGIHAPADPGEIPDRDIDEMVSLHPGVIKILNAHRRVNVLKASVPEAVFVVRLFLDFGGRKVSPADFVAWTIDDTLRVLSEIEGSPVWVEVHNEPNLVHEGLGASWRNGQEFSEWYLDVLQQLKARLPRGVKYLFPGVSPGPEIPGVRRDSLLFLEEARAAVDASDALGLHSYWAPQAGFPLDRALQDLIEALKLFPKKPFWVTEASNNKGGASAGQKASEMVSFWEELKKIEGARGVTFFVCNASNPAWGWSLTGSGETWAPVGMGALVRNLIESS